MRALYNSKCYVITYAIEGFVLKDKFYGETLEDVIEYFENSQMYDKIINIREELS